MRISALYVELVTAMWEYETNLTDDTGLRQSEAEERYNGYLSQVLAELPRFRPWDSCTRDTRRQLDLLALQGGLPVDAAQRAELSRLVSSMTSTYATASVTMQGKELKLDPGLSDLFAESRDPAELQAAWVAWRDAVSSSGMKKNYVDFVDLSNAGARDFGFPDTGALWRSAYDMPAAEFDAVVEELWEKLTPLYEQLHCHVRAKLSAYYGPNVVDAEAPLPAHLLGNMWGQQWGNIFDLVAPYPKQPSVNLDDSLAQQGYDAEQMQRLGESFYTSLGLDPLPEAFWKRSLFVRPPSPRQVISYISQFLSLFLL